MAGDALTSGSLNSKQLQRMMTALDLQSDKAEKINALEAELMQARSKALLYEVCLALFPALFVNLMQNEVPAAWSPALHKALSSFMFGAEAYAMLHCLNRASIPVKVCLSCDDMMLSCIHVCCTLCTCALPWHKPQGWAL